MSKLPRAEPSDVPDPDSHLRAFRRFMFGAFMMLGVVNPLLSRFLQVRGVADQHIGLIRAVAGIFAVVAPLLWGMASDAARDRRIPILVAVACSAGSFSLLYFCHSILSFLLVVVLFMCLFSGIIPMAVSVLFAYVEPRGKDYSRIRVFGTVGYMVTMILLYFPLRGARGIEAMFPAFLVCAALAAVTVLVLPAAPGSGRHRMDWSAVRLLGRRDFAVYLACTFAAQAAMGTHYAFFTLYLSRTLHVGDEYVGFFWAFGSLLELLMLTQTGRLIGRFGTKWVLVAGMFGVALRLAVYAAVPVLAVILIIQGLHALTFAAIHASTVTFVNYSVPTKWRASGQTLFDALTMGLGGSLGAWAGGLASQAWGYQWMFGLAAGAASATCLAFLVLGRSVALERRVEATPDRLPGQ